MKPIASILLVLVLVVCLAACSTSSAPSTSPTTEPTTVPTPAPTTPVHTHAWQDANCTTPKTCYDCGITEGEPAEHQFADATCSTAPTCAVCGYSEGDALGHTWNDGEIIYEATEEMAGEVLYTCVDCGTTETRVIPALKQVHS